MNLNLLVFLITLGIGCSALAQDFDESENELSNADRYFSDHSFLADNNNPNVLCLLGKCGTQLSACTSDKVCNTALNCVKGCNSSDPVAQQRCRIICTESTPSARYDNLVACMMNKGCMPKKKPTPCATPRNQHALASLTLADLEGAWHVIRGLSQVYDCWDCQKMTFTRQDDNLSRYDYEYVVKAPNKTSIPCNVQPVRAEPSSDPTPGRFLVNYSAHNIPGKDNWYILSYTNDYALIYYCGESSMDSYRGAVIMSRTSSTDLPPEVKTTFEKALKDADIATPVSLNEFCTPNNSACGS